MGPSNGYRVLLLVGVALAGAAVDSAAAQQDKPDGPGPSFFTRKNFNPSMAIVMIVLITAFFLLGFFSIYLRRCVGPPLGGPDEYASRAPGVGGGFALATARRAQRGLDRAVLDSFPTMAYADVKAHKAGGKGGALECAVCLSEFDDDEMLRLLPRCAHAFHADCIDAWLASHVTCPVCRAVLVHDAEAPAPAGAVSATEQGDVPASTQQPAPQTATARAPPGQAPPEQVSVVVVPAEETGEERIRREEAAELMRIGSVKRALRSKSGRRPAQFPRSHTTGHSLAAAAPDSAERYTLRLPEHVLQEVVAASRLRRSASVQSFWTRRGFGGARSGRSVRLGQSGRWPNMSLLARSISARLTAWGSTRRGEAVAPGEDAKVAGDGGGSPPGGRV
jgi:E3 ubiquitin-protein ligase ATL6/9/15/31/42/55